MWHSSISLSTDESLDLKRGKEQKRTWDWFFKAMNHFKLGDAEQARRCLDAGIEWLEEQNRADPDSLRSWGWTEQVESEQLRREAEELIKANEPTCNILRELAQFPRSSLVPARLPVRRVP